jgi:hypothetical protein
MKRKPLVHHNHFALLLLFVIGAVLSGCITVDCKGDCCGAGGGKEACYSHNPPTAADTTKFNCTQGDVCDPGGTCPRGKTCKTTVSGTTCSCGCQS